jgi:hypothetical protein
MPSIHISLTYSIEITVTGNPQPDRRRLQTKEAEIFIVFLDQSLSPFSIHSRAVARQIRMSTLPDEFTRESEILEPKQQRVGSAISSFVLILHTLAL